MTKQEVFNRVCTHFAEQGVQSKVRNAVNSGPRYKIFSRDGYVTHPCAIGILITEKNYSNDMEGHSIKELLDMPSSPLPKWMSKGEMAEYLQSLQQIHDESRSVKMLRSKLMNLAIDHELNSSLVHSIRSWNGHAIKNFTYTEPTSTAKL